MGSHHQVEGFILSNGLSSRMGRDKALLEIGNVPMLVKTARLLEFVAAPVTVVAGHNRYAHLGLPVIPECDIPIVGPRVGPVRGIVTALRHSHTPWNLIVSCDLPYITAEWLRFLVSRALTSTLADAVIANGLCVMFHKRSEKPLVRALGEGAYKFSKAMRYISCDFIPESEWRPFDPDGLLLTDMDLPEEYEQAKAILERQSNAHSAKAPGG